MQWEDVMGEDVGRGGYSGRLYREVMINREALKGGMAEVGGRRWCKCHKFPLSVESEPLPRAAVTGETTRSLDTVVRVFMIRVGYLMRLGVEKIRRRYLHVLTEVRFLDLHSSETCAKVLRHEAKQSVPRLSEFMPNLSRLQFHPLLFLPPLLHVPEKKTIKVKLCHQ